MKNRLAFLAYASLLLLSGVSPSFAQGAADGFYKPTAVEGYVRLFGKRMALPIQPLRAALLRNGVVPVQDNRIPVQLVKWDEVLEEFRFRGVKGSAEASGPSAIVLREDARGFSGSCRRPLFVRQRGKVRFIPVTVTMNTNLETKIRGDILSMEAPVTVKALGVSAQGRITLLAEKMDTPPWKQ